MNRSLGLTVGLMLAAGCAHAAGKDPLTPSFPIPNYTTSWIGNSFGGPTWVQHWCDDLYVAPDGTCYGATGWDEGGRETGIYKDGKVVGQANSTHGWGYSGGAAVTANSTYLFVAQALGHLGADQTGSVYPPTGSEWFGIGRRRLDGSDAPFLGGKGHGAAPPGSGTFLPINTTDGKSRADIGGLAASAAKLFAANPTAGEIDIYDAETMIKSGSFPAANCARIVYDAKDNTLWVSHKSPGADASTITHYSVDGKALGNDISLAAGVSARSMGIDRTADRLLVCDDGPGQQVLIYSGLSGTPKLSGTLGAKGGIYAGVPGQVGPLKFNGPTGVGVDSAGNVYVVSDNGGTVIESYSPSEQRLWRLCGLEFTECADIDPASPTDAYSGVHHYKLDLSQPSGKDSTYAAYTVDRFGHPDDPRIAGWGCGSMFVRRIHGKRFLFGTSMNAGDMQVYRFTSDTSELTAPSVIFAPGGERGASVPAAQPAAVGWIWRDSNGDGKFTADKFDADRAKLPTAAWSVDSNGDVWVGAFEWRGNVATRFIRQFACQGLDSSGNPIYSFKSAIEIPAPAPFVGKAAVMERLDYIAATDTMYISGFTDEHPNLNRDWKTSGPVICRYDNWSKSPVKRWEIDVPWESAQTPDSHHGCPDAISVAGKLLFNGYLVNGEIRAYDTDDGSYVGSLLPGAEVDKTSGWIDTMYGVRASQLPDGDYLVFAEEVWHEKTLMYKLSYK